MTPGLQSSAEDSLPLSLCEAINSNDLGRVTELLDSGCDPDVCYQNESCLPLLLASTRGHSAVVEMLLNKGANVFVSDHNRSNALHKAVEEGHVEVAYILLKENADLESREKFNGFTPIHLAVQKNFLEILQALVQAAADRSDKVLNIKDKQGRTALHLAVEAGQMNAVLLLLQAGANVHIIDDNGQTAIHLAILAPINKKWRQSLLSLLLSKCDYQAVPDNRQQQFVTPLSHSAAQAGCTDSLVILEKSGEDLNQKDSLGRTLLHVAVSHSRRNVLQWLINRKVDVRVKDNRGLTSMHYAIVSSHIPMIEDLLKEGDYLQTDEGDGWDSLCFALQRRALQSFEALIRCGVHKVQDKHIIHYCAATGDIQALSILLDNGEDINMPDASGMTALHHALSNGQEEMAAFLIKKGALVSSEDLKGATPLHHAVRWGGSDAILRLLVKKKASLRATDRLGRTPLHYAACKTSIISDMFILVGSGAEVNCADKMGLTPLHLAARLGNESLVRILLDTGADSTLKDVHNFMPLDHAIENKHLSIIKRLQKHSNKDNAAN